MFAAKSLNTVYLICLMVSLVAISKSNILHQTFEAVIRVEGMVKNVTGELSKISSDLEELEELVKNLTHSVETVDNNTARLYTYVTRIEEIERKLTDMKEDTGIKLGEIMSKIKEQEEVITIFSSVESSSNMLLVNTIHLFSKMLVALCCFSCTYILF